MLKKRTLSQSRFEPLSPYSMKWERINDLTLRAYCAAHISDGEYEKNYFGLAERDVDPVQAWCQENHCGRRTSFDTFVFRNRTEVSMFLLRWS